MDHFDMVDLFPKQGMAAKNVLLLHLGTIDSAGLNISLKLILLGVSCVNF
jgi:hypothetical protein